MALRTVLKLAEKVAAAAEQRIKKELNALVKSGIVSRKEAKHMLTVAVREAKREKQRVKKFITAELKRELKRAKPLIKKAVAKKRKQFEQYRKKRKR